MAGICDLKKTSRTVVHGSIGVGSILAIGGGITFGDPSSQWVSACMKNTAGGDIPRIALLNSSRASLQAANAHYYCKDSVRGSDADQLRALGFEPIYIPLAIDTGSDHLGDYVNEVAESPYWAGVIKTCEVIFLQGGDQAKHAKCLLRGNGEDTRMLAAIRSVHRRGGLIAGTSAGMHVMSRTVLGYGHPGVVLNTNDTEALAIADIPIGADQAIGVENNNVIHPGIALLPPFVMTDTHFDARGRLGRLVVALRDADAKIGVGADEGTGLLMMAEGGETTGEVVGNRGVFIVDATNANYSAKGRCVDFEVTNLKLHYLTSGDRYCFDSKKVIVGFHKKESVAKDGDGARFPEGVDPFGGDYGTTQWIDAFINRPESMQRIEDSTGFDVIFEKKAGFCAYRADQQSVIAGLVSCHQVTVIHLTLSVVKGLR